MSATLDAGALARLPRPLRGRWSRRAAASRCGSSTCRSRSTSRPSRSGTSPPGSASGWPARRRATCWSSCRAPTRSAGPSQAIQGTRGSRDFAVFPLHGELPPEAQDRAVARYDGPQDHRLHQRRRDLADDRRGDGGRSTAGSRGSRGSTRTAASTRCSSRRSPRRAPTSARAGPGAPPRASACGSGRSASTASAPAQELPEVKRLDLAEVVLTLKAGGSTTSRPSPGWSSPTRRRWSGPRRCWRTWGPLAGPPRRADHAITDRPRGCCAFPSIPATPGCSSPPRSAAASARWR